MQHKIDYYWWRIVNISGWNIIMRNYETLVDMRYLKKLSAVSMASLPRHTMLVYLTKPCWFTSPYHDFQPIFVINDNRFDHDYPWLSIINYGWPFIVIIHHYSNHHELWLVIPFVATATLFVCSLRSAALGLDQTDHDPFGHPARSAHEKLRGTTNGSGVIPCLVGDLFGMCYFPE